VDVDVLESRRFECLETEGAFPKAASVVAKMSVHTSLVRAASLTGHRLDKRAVRTSC
jgi:hypothetical protein